MNFIDPVVAGYLRELTNRFDEPVLLEMEALAEQRGFPIVGRVVGSTLELLARAIGARRVFELGSGFGFSAYWFSRAVGDGGEVYLTDTDAANAELAESFLTRAKRWGPCRFRVGDAVAGLGSTGGLFDIVYNDIDKAGYPAAFAAARARIRPGGLYLCDNVLWSGKVARGETDPDTSAIREHNATVSSDPDFASAVVPTRDGVMVALRLR